MMSRADVGEVPEFPVPTGFVLRWFKPGDERVWLEIQAAADEYDSFDQGRHEREFGTDVAELEQRQCFLCTAGGQAMGTATAWRDDLGVRPGYGRIHWVAVLPAYQGQGLSKPLLTAACRRLRELGHRGAYLTTSTARIVAINLYLSFGFVPDVRNAREKEAWSRLRGVLKRPVDPAAGVFSV
jgi:GNAT superfamily N-acetyltransferase